MKSLRMMALLLAIATVSGCGTECEDGEMKCNGEVVLICESKQWEKKEVCSTQGLRCNFGGFCGPMRACCQL